MITILTPSRVFQFGTDEWGNDKHGYVHVYDGETTLATFTDSEVDVIFQNLSTEQHEKLADEIELDVVSVSDPKNKDTAETTTTT